MWINGILKCQLNIKDYKIYGLLLVLTVILLLSSSATAYGAVSGWRKENHHSKEDIGSSVRNNILSFENSMVEAGKPLVVNGAPSDAVFEWTITAADKTVKTFVTTQNQYLPKKEDLEKLITVTAEGLEGGIAAIYYSKLPVVYINNDKGYYGVGIDFSDAVMEVQKNDEFNKKDLYQGQIEIKLRGNSTMLREKAPFNIKLDKKTNLLNMGENKHWALLANDIDHTQMRNKLLYEFSGDIGMDTYMKSENVVLIFNNQYYGVYQLCELVDIGADRVDVYDWEESAKKAAKAIAENALKEHWLTDTEVEAAEENLENAMCNNLSWITSPYQFTYDLNLDGVDETYTITDDITLPEPTGGVLLEMDFNAFGGENPSTMITSYAQPIYFKSPEYAITNPILFQNMKRYIQSFEYALHSSDYIYHESAPKYEAVNRAGGNKNQGYKESSFSAPEYDGKHYSELFDMDSLIQNFLVCEFSMNWDSMKNSVFFYKDIDGLFHVGPEWDFDWAFGNINMFGRNTWFPTSWHTTEPKITVEQFYQTVQWNRCLIRDPYFLAKAYEKYKEIRKTDIEDMIKSGGTIDTYAEELKEAAKANDERWGSTYKQYKSVGFEESVTNLKKFLSIRVNWLDEQFESLDTFITSLGYYKPSSELQITTVDTKNSEGEVRVITEVTNPEIAFITLQVNGIHQYTSEVKDGKSVCRISGTDLISDEEKWNVIQVLAKSADQNYIIDTTKEGNYSNVKSNYAVFYSNEGYYKKQDQDISDLWKHPTGNEIIILATVIIAVVAVITMIRIIVSKNKKDYSKKD